MNKIIKEFLDSRKKFFFDTPLYTKFNLLDEDVLRRVPDLCCYTDETVDIYCVTCKSKSIFKCQSADIVHIPESIINFNPLVDMDDRIYLYTYTCSRNENHKYEVIFKKIARDFVKIGQYPSLMDYQESKIKKYRKILGNNYYGEFVRGIGLASHGVGIGSFIYLRRIFENLIVKAEDAAAKDGIQINKKDKIEKRIKSLRDFLPEFLVSNSEIYSILSDGLHNLDEKKCLEYFDAIKNGIEQILDEEVFKKEQLNKKKEVQKNIKKIRMKNK